MRLVQVYEWWRPDDARLSDPFQKRVKHIDGFFHQWGVDVVEAAEGFGTFSVAIVEPGRHHHYASGRINSVYEPRGKAMTTTQQAKAFLQAADSLAGLKPAMLAEQLEISETTLRRKLRQEGANFAKLLTEERKWRCAQALAANPHISLADLSDICGFSMSSG